MNEPKTSQPGGSGSISGKVRNRNAFLVADNNSFNGTSSSYKEADLTSDFSRYFCDKPGNFRGNNFLGRDSSSINMLYLLDLTRL